MSVNIVNQDGTLKKIAHGFPESKFDILKSDIANHIETTDMASRDYEAGDVFIMANGHMVRALNDIDEDTTISASDVEDITVTELIAEHTEKLDDKADKVSSATSGNLAGLNASGNLTDSGWAGAKDTTSISGNPISITGLKSNQLAVNPIITFEPIQAGSGTPSPSNIRAISGYDKIEVLSCGINVWDEQWELGELNAQGQNASSTTKIRSKNYIPVVGGSTYYLKLSSASAQVFLCFYDVNKTFISSNTPYQGTFTVPLMARYCRFNCPATYGTTYNNDMGINYPATQTSYVASNKTTDLSESLGQTVYGLTHEVRTGKATVTLKAVDMGDLDYYRVSDNVFTVTISDKKSSSNRMYCSCFDYEVNKGYALDSDCISDSNASGYATTVFIKTTASYSSSALFKTAVTGQKLVYPLATPITIQLTPHEISLLKDYAYVSTNGTNITFDYHNGELASLADVSQLGETVNKGLGSVIDISNDISKESTVTDFFACGYRIGNIVTIHIRGIIPNQYGNLAYIDEKHAPKKGLSSFPVNTTITDGDGYQVPSYGQIGSTGTVYVVNKGQSGRQTHVTATYIAN